MSDYAGVWDGYAEAFTRNDGTDRIRITLDSQGMGTLNDGDPSDADTAKPVDCGQTSTCLSYCTCTKSSCSTDLTEDAQVDAALTPRLTMAAKHSRARR